MTVTPDTLKVNPAGPNTADKTHMNCVMIYPDTEAPHTPYASLMKLWITNSRRVLNL